MSSRTSASLHRNNTICLCEVRTHLFGNFNPFLYLISGGCGEQLISLQHVKSFYQLCRTLEYKTFCLWSTGCPSEALAPTSAVLSSIHPVSKPCVLHAPLTAKRAGYHMLMLRPWLLYE